MGGDSGFGHGGLVIVFMSSHEVSELREREKEILMKKKERHN